MVTQLLSVTSDKAVMFVDERKIETDFLQLRKAVA